MQLLFLIGWVHRAISPGSLLWDSKSIQGLLNDLEYAKESNTKGSGNSDRKIARAAFV